MEDINKYIRDLRKDFSGEPLEEKSVFGNPVKQFEHWFKEAVSAKVNEPNAMVISTVSNNNKPSGRVVLLREFSENGFAFFTNYTSKKAEEIQQNPNACLTFFWPELERQVRIEGKVQRHNNTASDNYFHSRPKSSRVGAWSSPQSKKISGRKELEDLVTEFDKKYQEEFVPRPDFWGGYLLLPDYFEFWQGRPSRLHDRIVFERKENNNWELYRLAP